MTLTRAPTAMPGLVVGIVLAACSPSLTSAPPSAGATAAPTTVASVTTAPTSSAVAVATVEPTIAACVPNPTDTGPALAGIVELRPAGWTFLSNGVGVPGFPEVQWNVYGPEGPEVPRQEGAGRLVLYEAWPPSDAYFRERVTASKEAGGQGVAVTVCGDATELWTNRSTGELLVGWTYRGKSDVLVANVTDFTPDELIESAERVYECCG